MADPGGPFGELVIERELGHGAFGRVYLAQDSLIGRRVALKVVAGPPEARERMVREARLVGQLVHPNIVTLHRVYPPEDGNQWGFEFEYVEGGTLQDLLASAPLPPDRQLALARGIAAGLEAAHRAGIVHGDVKPRNVLLARDGTPKLADFGLGRLLGDLSLHISERGTAVGTPAFMAPEVLMGEPITPAADLWSLGVVLYFAACGRHPFSSTHLHDLIYSIQNVEPAAPPPATPPAIAAALRMCLAKRPEDRPRDAAPVAQILRGERAPAPPPAPRPPVSVLRGRERELATLHERIDAVLQRREGSATLVIGEDGIGKSALAAEAAQWMGRAGGVWVTARVSAMEGVVRPLLRGVRVATSTPSLAAARFDSTRERIERLLDSSDGLRIETSQSALATLERTLDELLGSSPLGVVIEDVHEGNADDVQIAAHLAGRLAAEGAAVLLLTRPGTAEVAELGTHAFLHAMPLERLAPEDAYAMLEDHAGKLVDPRAARLIHEKAAGNPRHMLELFRHLLECETLRAEDNRIVPGPRWGSLELPRRFRDLVAQRLERLPDEDHELLEVAAVAGPRFDGAELAEVAQRPVLQVLRRLQKIYRERGLVVPLQEGYRFSSPIVQEVIYNDLAPDLRRVLHRSIATRLAEREGVDPERLAIHWESAGDPARAAPYFLEAARRATRRLEMHRAIELARRGGLRAESLDAQTAAAHSDVLLSMSGIHYQLGQMPQAERVVDALMQAARASGDEALRLRASVRRYDLRYRVEGADAVDLAEMERAGQELPPCPEKVLADYLRGIVLKFRGDIVEAGAALERATRSLDQFPHDGLRASVTDQLASLRMRSGELAEAEALYAEAARLAARCGRRSHAATSEVNRALVAFQRGSFDGLEEHLRRAIRSLDLESASSLAAHARLILAMVQAARGDLPAAELTAARAVELLRGSRYWLGLGDGLLLQGGLHHLAGRYGEALATLEQAEELGRRDGFLQVRCAALGAQAKVLCAQGEADAAEVKAQACMELARATEDQAVRRQAAGLLAEAVLMGLRPPRDLEALAASAAGSPEETLVRAALAWQGKEIAPLAAAAARLRASDIGERQAELRVLAGLLETEALRRQGLEAEASRCADRSREEARRLGHAWLVQVLRNP